MLKEIFVTFATNSL